MADDAKTQTPQKSSDPMAAKVAADQYLESVAVGDQRSVHFYQGTFWLWRGGRYVSLSTDDMQAEVYRWLVENRAVASKTFAENITYCLRAFVQVDPVKFPGWLPPVAPRLRSDWVALRNKLVDPEGLARGEGLSVIGHTPKWFSPVVLPYDYDPEATCERWQGFLIEMLGDRDKIDLLQEFMGYLLTPDTRKHAALFLVGESGSGKSTIMRVMEKLVGTSNTLAMKPQDLRTNFGPARLKGKLLNLIDEVDAKLPKGLETLLKWVISGGTITADRKYLDDITFQPTARMVLGCNRFPQFSDPTSGIWRRVHVLKFDHSIPVAAQDDNLGAVFEGELPGVFNWAIAGLARLRKIGKFTCTVSGTAAVASYRDSQNTEEGFVREQIVEKPAGFVSNAVLLEAYDRWCKENGLPAASDLTDLKAVIARMFAGTTPDRKAFGGRQIRGTKGIELKR